MNLPGKKNFLEKYLTLAARELASSTDHVHHLIQLMRRAKLCTPAFMAIVRLPCTARVLAATILHIDHPFLFMGGAVLSPLSVHAIRGLSCALVVLAPGYVPTANDDVFGSGSGSVRSSAVPALYAPRWCTGTTDIPSGRDKRWIDSPDTLIGVWIFSPRVVDFSGRERQDSSSRNNLV